MPEEKEIPAIDSSSSNDQLLLLQALSEQLKEPNPDRYKNSLEEFLENIEQASVECIKVNLSKNIDFLQSNGFKVDGLIEILKSDNLFFNLLDDYETQIMKTLGLNRPFNLNSFKKAIIENRQFFKIENGKISLNPESNLSIELESKRFGQSDILTHTVYRNIGQILQDRGLKSCSFSVGSVWDLDKAKGHYSREFTPIGTVLFPGFLFRLIEGYVAFSSEGYEEENEVKIHLPEGVVLPFGLACGIVTDPTIWEIPRKVGRDSSFQNQPVVADLGSDQLEEAKEKLKENIGSVGELNLKTVGKAIYGPNNGNYIASHFRKDENKNDPWLDY